MESLSHGVTSTKRKQRPETANSHKRLQEWVPENCLIPSHPGKGQSSGVGREPAYRSLRVTSGCTGVWVQSQSLFNEVRTWQN